MWIFLGHILGLIGVFIFISSIILLQFYGELPGAIAEIEQLRKDYMQPSQEYLDHVKGQVVKKNQLIANYKKYRKVWWVKYYLPSKWDNVEYIKI